MLIVSRCSTSSRRAKNSDNGRLLSSMWTRVWPTAQCSQRMLHMFEMVNSTLVSTWRPCFRREWSGSHRSCRGEIAAGAISAKLSGMNGFLLIFLRFIVTDADSSVHVIVTHNHDG